MRADEVLPVPRGPENRYAWPSRPAAARFSFLLSLPSVFAAGVKELYDWWKEVKADPVQMDAATDQLVALAVGTLVAFVVGYAAIAWLMNFLRRYSMLVFIVYRIALGLLILVLVVTGVLDPAGSTADISPSTVPR